MYPIFKKSFSEKACERCSARSTTGQVLLLTTITLGGMLLGATTIAGFLVVYQIRQAGDMANSGKAIFAADTGIEWGLYQFFKGTGRAAPALSNRASFTTACSPVANCNDITTRTIIATGKYSNAERALELDLQQ